MSNKGHVWHTEPNGERSYYEFYTEDAPFCAGPSCVKCGYSYCEHCSDEPLEDCCASKRPPEQEHSDV